MKYNQLGRTGLFVSEICLGAMTFGGNADAGIWKAIGALEQDEVDEIVGQALARGRQLHRHRRRLFLRRVRAAARPGAEEPRRQARKDVVIATKVFGEMGPGPNDRGASRGHIMDSGPRQPGAAADRPHRPLPDPRQRHASRRSTRPCGRWTTSSARAWCATSASPTGRPGRSPRRWASARPRATPASRPCRPTTPSPAATWSASWSRC